MCGVCACVVSPRIVHSLSNGGGGGDGGGQGTGDGEDGAEGDQRAFELTTFSTGTTYRFRPLLASVMTARGKPAAQTGLCFRIVRVATVAFTACSEWDGGLDASESFFLYVGLFARRPTRRTTSFH